MSAVKERKGERTRRSILDAAAKVASVEGLEPLSIGRLAEATGMSKSGLFAHFGSKLELQLATVDHAAAIFRREVIEPAHAAPRGIARVWALCERSLGYAERRVFPGGCFFMTTSVEFNNRPGPVRDRIRELVGSWLDYLAAAVADAQRRGELRADADPERVAFELHAIATSADSTYQLFRDERVFADARAALRERLDALAP